MNGASSLPQIWEISSVSCIVQKISCSLVIHTTGGGGGGLCALLENLMALPPWSSVQKEFEEKNSGLVRRTVGQIHCNDVQSSLRGKVTGKQLSFWLTWNVKWNCHFRTLSCTPNHKTLLCSQQQWSPVRNLSSSDFFTCIGVWVENWYTKHYRRNW